MLTEAQLTSIRETMAPSRTEEAYMKRAGYTADGKGGRIASDTTLGPYRVRVRTIAHLGEAEQLIAGRLTGETRYGVSFEALADVRRADRIVVSGLTLEVVNVLGPTTREATRRAQCIEVA